VNVNNDNVKGLIEGRKQFEVPIWQRQYTWGPKHYECAITMYRSTARREPEGPARR